MFFNLPNKFKTVVLDNGTAYKELQMILYETRASRLIAELVTILLLYNS